MGPSPYEKQSRPGLSTEGVSLHLSRRNRALQALVQRLDFYAICGLAGTGGDAECRGRAAEGRKATDQKQEQGAHGAEKLEGLRQRRDKTRLAQDDRFINSIRSLQHRTELIYHRSPP